MEFSVPFHLHSGSVRIGKTYCFRPLPLGWNLFCFAGLCTPEKKKKTREKDRKPSLLVFHISQLIGISGCLLPKTRQVQRNKPHQSWVGIQQQLGILLLDFPGSSQIYDNKVQKQRTEPEILKFFFFFKVYAVELTLWHFWPLDGPLMSIPWLPAQ